MLLKVISGGQIGVDYIGLMAARKVGISTGGTAAKNWVTEAGPAPWLANFGLVEAKAPGYPIRTKMNVRNSDGTVLFGDMESVGSYLTITECKDKKKPYICNPTVDQLIEFVRNNKIFTLNVAGNRATRLSEYQTGQILSVLLKSFESLKQII